MSITCSRSACDTRRRPRLAAAAASSSPGPVNIAPPTTQSRGSVARCPSWRHPRSCHKHVAQCPPVRRRGRPRCRGGSATNRQARHRFLRAVGRPEAVAPGRSLRLAYADPPYPGKAWLYRDHPDYGGEVDHAALMGRLAAYDGWALSTSVEALPAVLALSPPGVRVAAWHRGERPTRSRWPLHAWEPVWRAPVQGMARVRSGQARPAPWFLTGVSVEVPGSSVTSRVRAPGTYSCAGCPAGTVMLEAGGADTDTQRAIPGPEPSQDSDRLPDS